MSATARKFDDAPAVRSATPLLFGLIGPSGSGKTYSALRLATGMREVTGGDIFMIDTEGNRGLHYADLFDYRHVPFKPPFSPDDYSAAIKHCVSSGAKIIIVDSMSHEHTGQGGVLEWHAAEVERISKAWGVRADKANMPAWQKPKAARRALINEIIQCGCNMILCFRAKDKIKINTKGKTEIVQLGFMPEAGEEFVYELTAKALLLPGAEGVPTWNPDNPGEQMMTKLPAQFRDLFSGKAGKPLDEETGERMARWAAGDEAPEQSKPKPADEPASKHPSGSVEDFCDKLRKAKTMKALTNIGFQIKESTLSDDDKATCRAVYDKERERITSK